MAGGCAEKPSFGRITSGLSQGDLALKTIRYVLEHLPSWRDDPKRPYEDSEDKLNAQLCKFLDSHARNDFPMIRFDREERQVERRSADLSASPAGEMVLEAKQYSIYEPILVIECKRLPTPSKGREREYVTGGAKRCGGIQRFKLGLYAREHRLAVLVGYVQDESLQHWHRTVNCWISDLINRVQLDESNWFEEERLGDLLENPCAGTSTCLSSHRRSAGAEEDRIEIHHLWISMIANAHRP